MHTTTLGTQGSRARGRGRGKRKAAESVDLTGADEEQPPTVAAPPAASDAIRSGNAYMLVYRRRGFEDTPGALSTTDQCTRYAFWGGTTHHMLTGNPPALM